MTNVQELIQKIINNSNLQSRPYQERICTKVTDMLLHQGLHSIMIESPTGSGKTCIAQVIATALQTLHPESGIAWVAMRRNLLTQAEDARNKANLPVNMEYISMFSNNIPTHDAQGRKISIVITDECHHDATTSMVNLYQTINPHWIIGMSATPHRTDRAKLCFEHTVRDAGIYQLIQQEYLASYHHYSIENWTPQFVAETYLREPERFGKSAFYFRTSGEAEECTNLLRAGGVPTELVTGSTDREAQLERFRTGEVKALVNMFVLTEGFDSPDLQTVFVRDSTKSPTIQMGGRVFRQHPTLKYKQIVQSRVTKWPFTRTAKPAQSFTWDNNSWRGYELSPHIDRIALKATMTTLRTTVEMPDIIMKYQMTRRRRSNTDD